MKKFVYIVVLSLLTACAAERGNVVTGGLSESKYVEKTAQTIYDEGLGTYTVLFRKGPWNPDMLNRVIKVCREKGMTFTMDEVMDRQNYGPYQIYRDSLSQIIDVLRENADIMDGTLVLGEFGGVNFAWPATSARKGTASIPPVSTYSQVDAWVRHRVKSQTDYADSLGLPRPYISIGPEFGAYSHLLRSVLEMKLKGVTRLSSAHQRLSERIVSVWITPCYGMVANSMMNCGSSVIVLHGIMHTCVEQILFTRSMV